MLSSDDFGGLVLDQVWTLNGAAAVTADLAADGDEKFLTLSTQDGVHDLWNGSTGAARLMQAAVDEDLTLQARFLSVPSERYQMQGILVEQDASNWIRFDTYSDGSVLRVFAGVTINGSSSVRINGVVDAAAASHLRVERVGDTWTLLISGDGETWTAAGSFDLSLAVAEAGLFAGNTGGATGFTAEVDYLEVNGDPLLIEDGEVISGPPVAGDDALSTDSDTSLAIDVAQDLLSNDSDPDGSALTLTGVTAPSNGVLIDNNDGTFTYIANPGFSGTDSFDYTVSDAQGDSATATATITVTSNVLTITGTSAGETLQGTDDGEIIDGAGGADTLRGNGGNDILDGGAGRDKLYGGDGEDLLFADINDRDLLYGGADADEFVFQTGGTQSVVTRIFDFERGVDKINLIELGLTFDDLSFKDTTNGSNSIITVNSVTKIRAIGILKDEWEASDFLFEAADPNFAPIARDDALAATTDAAITANLFADHGSGADSDVDGDPLTLLSIEGDTDGSVTLASGATVSFSGDGSISYDPNGAFDGISPGTVGIDTFTYTIGDGTGGIDTATVTVTVNPPPSLASDDFSGATLSPFWTLEGAGNASAELATDGPERFVELTAGDGVHDMWNASTGATRLMQTTEDEDFALEVRFLSTPTERYQMQGLLVEQDATNWIRFDTYSDGSVLRIFAAVTVNGASAVAISGVVSAADASHLRVEREGDDWTLSISGDGINWTSAGTFTHVLAVASAGVFAGNTGGASGFTAEVDYFEIGSDPLIVEDSQTTNSAPVAGDDALNVITDTTLAIDVEADLLANDSDANGDILSLTSFTAPSNGTLVDNSDGTLTYTPNAGYLGPDSFTYTVSDGSASTTAVVTIGVIPPPVLSSDDFGDAALESIWTMEGPEGSIAELAIVGDERFLELTTADGEHDLWNTSTGATRLMQAANDEDMTLEVRFLSEPAERFQMQGIVVEQDESNWLRFDVYSDGNVLRIFAASTVEGASSARISSIIPSGAASHLRVERDGDNWTLLISSDGVEWAAAGSFVHSLTVSKAGVFAGNIDGASGYTAQIDYFEVGSDPIAVEDPPNAAPETGDDLVTTDENESIIIDIAADLLANDSDPEGLALSL
ncbi:MAG: Ig-like domain-containing protein, partial [Pseudomonadota bacterium]